MRGPGVFVSLVVTLSLLAGVCEGVGTYSSSGAVQKTRGEGIPGVEIVFFLVEGEGGLPAPVMTDGEGRFSQSGFSEGCTYAAEPSKAGWLFGPPRIEFSSQTEGVLFIGRPPFSVSGNVSDEAGKGVAGVTVVFSLASGTGAVPAAVTTNADGGFSQSGFTNGAGYRAAPQKDDLVFSPIAREFSVETASVPLTFTLIAPYALSGNVLDTQGKPVSEVEISFSDVMGEGNAPPPVLTNQNGFWAQSGFSHAASYVVTARKRGYSFDPPYEQVSGPAADVDFMATPPYSVSGRVTDESGRGVEGVEMRFPPKRVANQEPWGCVAAYDFEGSCEDSVGENDGVGADVGYVESKAGYSKAAYFYRSRSVVNIGNGPAIANLSRFTVSAWIFPLSDGESDAAKIFFKYSPPTGYIRFEVCRESAGSLRLFGRVECAVSAAESLSKTTDMTLTLGAWHHVAMTWDNETGKVGLFVDGAEAPYNYQMAGVGAQGDDSAGGGCIGNTDFGERRFDGCIDSFRMYRRVLSKAEIQGLFDEGGALTAPPPVNTAADGTWSQEGFWGGCEYETAPFKTGWGFTPVSREFGETAQDIVFAASPPYEVSGKVIAASGKGDGDTIPDGVPQVKLTFKRRNGGMAILPGCVAAYDFEGTCEDKIGENEGTPAGIKYVESGRDGSLAANFCQNGSAVNIGGDSQLDNLATFTLAGWICPRSDGEGDNGRIFSKHRPEEEYIRFQVCYERAGAVHLFGRVTCKTGFAESLSNLSGRGIPLNTWHHVAMTWNSAAGTVRLYIDGEEVPYNYQARGPDNQKDDSAGEACIGNWVTENRGFDGYTDDFGIFNRVLTAVELKRMAGIPGGEEAVGPVTAGQDGRWVQVGFSGGQHYSVTPSKPGWGFSPRSREFGGAANGVDFLATPPYSVSGRVVDPLGKGVAGAVLKFSPRVPGVGVPAPVSTDESGYYVQGGFWGLCEYGVIPLKNGWGFEPDFRQFAGAAADVNFVASPPYAASGKIVDPSGRPVSGVTISFSSSSRTGLPPGAVSTAEDGTWLQTGFEGEVRYVATPTKQGWIFDPIRREFTGEAKNQDFVAMPPYSAQGRVADASGKGVGGVRITFETESGPWLPPPVVTDTDGYWHQTGFAYGSSYRAAPSKESWVFDPGLREFSEECRDQDFTGTPPYGVTGKVVDESGKGVEGVAVTFWVSSGSGFVPSSALTDGNGAWSQNGFSARAGYGVAFKKDGWAFAPSWVGFSGPVAEIVVVGSGPYSVSGRVTDAEGNGIGGVKIVFSPRVGSRLALFPATTAADGSWSQSGFARGSTYWAIPSSRDSKFSPTYREFSGPAAGLDFVAEAAYGVSGTVLDGDGNAVPGVRIVFRRMGRWGASPPPVTTGNDGRFSQSGFTPDAPYRATPEKTGWSFVPAYIDFNSATDMVFSAKAPYSVSGRITDRSGVGVEGVQIIFAADGLLAYTPDPVTTDSSGAFSRTGFWGGMSYKAIPKRDRWTFLPGMRQFGDATDRLDFEGHEPQATLTMESEYGTPLPPRGDNKFAIGSTVNAAVDALVLEGANARHTCAGWAGTGSVPATGTEALFSFVIQEDSSLTWLWKTEFRLNVSASPEELGTVTVSGGEWYEKGTRAAISAKPKEGYIFSGWSGEAAGRARTISLAMDRPRTVVGNFTEDSDSDGLPDDWERGYFGDLSEDGFGDGDQDEAPNLVEYTFDTDPTQPTPKLTVVMSECGANVAIEFPAIKNKVSVLDAASDSVGGLAETDFVVWEDNVPQSPLEVTESGGADAVSVALVLDNSGSMAGSPLEDSHNAANVFIDQLKEGDSAAVIKFGTTVSLVQPFTSDKEALHGAVNGAFGGFGDTAFYSAIYRALHESIVASGARAVVALTDGVDNSSSHGLQQVMDYARRVGVPVFVIGLGSVAEDALREIAESTGGRYYYAPDSSGLQGIYEEVSRIAANWYQVDYATSNPDANAPLYPRSVAVWAHSNGAIGRDDGQYKPPRENTAPLCHVDTPQGEQQGDVNITFQLFDFESDACFVEVFFSRDGGWSWNRATLTPESVVENLGSSPQGVGHAMVWRSGEDMPGVDSRVQLKVVPYDPKKGTAAETSEFAVRNNSRPRAEVDTPVGIQSGNVTNDYRLVDAEGDPCSIKVEYSLDGGGKWSPARRGNGGDGEVGLSSSAEGSPHVFVWDSLHNVGYRTSETVRVKITPFDRKAGQAGETGNFTVSNISPVRLSYSPQSLAFMAQEGGENPAAQALEIWNSGGGVLSWRVESDSSWLTLSTNSGQSSGEKDEVAVEVDISGLSAGIYRGEIGIEASDLVGGSSVVLVTLTVEEPPGFIVVSPEKMVFSAVLSEGDPKPQPLQVRNGGGGEMTWQAWVSAAWLSVTPDVGSGAGETDVLTVSPHIIGLIPGTYRATITIVAPRASNTPKTVSVTLILAKSRPQIAVQPESLVFTADEGAGDPAAQMIQIWNAGGLTLWWQAQGSPTWITVSPDFGASTGNMNEVSVLVHAAGLSAGTHSGFIVVSGDGATNSPLTIPVELRLKPAVADMTVSPTQLLFTTGRGGPNPPSQEITISSNGKLSWQVSYDAGWLRVTPTLGAVDSGSGAVTVSAVKAGLDLGTYQGKITVKAVGANVAEKVVPVTLNIKPIEIPADYPTIQKGVEAGFDGDVVLVASGTYPENIAIRKNIEVRSLDGPESTAIDGTGLGSVVSFESVRSARLEGFTIVNGTGSRFGRSAPVGGGIYCVGSSPVISECQIVGNSATWGGGICVDSGSSPTIVDSAIMGNLADDGGGIFCYEKSSPKFTTTIVAENSAYWYGGGVCGIEESRPVFAGCLFYDNSADLSGGGAYATQGCDLQLVSCTMSDNSSGEGGNILAEPGSLVTILNSSIWGSPGDMVLLGQAIVKNSNVSEPKFAGVNGNIMAEPIYFDPENGDYHLLPSSPCIDSGSNDVSSLPEKDLDGDPRILPVGEVPITDIGADELDPDMVFIRTSGQVHVAADGEVTVSYTLWNARSISCPVIAEYSDDGGRTWHPATAAPGGEVPTGVASSPQGQTHTFVWNSTADIGNQTGKEVTLRFRAEAPKTSRPALTEPFHIER